MDLSKQKPKITIFEPVDYSIKISFKDRTNTSYEIIKEVINDIGYIETYKDYFLRALDPNIDKQPTIYGVAKKLQPKTKTINDMKKTIDTANSNLQDLVEKTKQQSEQVQQQKQNDNLTTGGNENDRLSK